jgi:hypothetical protein
MSVTATSTNSEISKNGGAPAANQTVNRAVPINSGGMKELAQQFLNEEAQLGRLKEMRELFLMNQKTVNA